MHVISKVRDWGFLADWDFRHGSKVVNSKTMRKTLCCGTSVPDVRIGITLSVDRLAIAIEKDIMLCCKCSDNYLEDYC